jgi:transposase
MRQKSGPVKQPATQVLKTIRRATRRHFSAEDKIRIVLEGLRGEDSIAELCRREGIVQNLYYRWSKEFLEAGKKRLAGDTARAATSDEVRDLRREAGALKEVVAELTLERHSEDGSEVRCPMNGVDGERAIMPIGRPTATARSMANMKRVLITGMSGTGKSAVVRELIRRCHSACNFDPLSGVRP